METKLRTIHDLTTPTPWHWSRDSDKRRVRVELDEIGLCWFRMDGSIASARSDASAFVQAVLGSIPTGVDVTTIRYDASLAAARPCFPNTRYAIPLHTDGHFTELPMQFLIMVCVNRSSRDGACLFQDGWHIVDSVRRSDQELYAALFNEQRRLTFISRSRYYEMPTISECLGSSMLIHPAFVDENDSIGRRFQSWVNRGPVLRIYPDPDDVLVVNNWRMLHARDAFEDDAREYVRLWPHGLTPCPAPDFLRSTGRA